MAFAAVKNTAPRTRSSTGNSAIDSASCYRYHTTVLSASQRACATLHRLTAFSQRPIQLWCARSGLAIQFSTDFRRHRRMARGRALGGVGIADEVTLTMWTGNEACITASGKCRAFWRDIIPATCKLVSSSISVKMRVWGTDGFHHGSPKTPICLSYSVALAEFVEKPVENSSKGSTYGHCLSSNVHGGVDTEAGVKNEADVSDIGGANQDGSLASINHGARRQIRELSRFVDQLSHVVKNWIRHSVLH